MSLKPCCKNCGAVYETHYVDGGSDEHLVWRCPNAGTTYEPCAECAEGTPVPHIPSSSCRSGKRPHCTCEACF